MMAMLEECPVPVYQNAAELQRALEIYRAIQPRRMLEIGSLYGGTLWHWLRNAQPGALVVSIDIPPDLSLYHMHPIEAVVEARAHWQSWALAASVALKAFWGMSASPEIVGIMHNLAPFDWIFVDGGHDYESVSNDFSLYWPMVRTGGAMAFHDIAYPDQNSAGIDVGRWWRELEATRCFNMEAICHSQAPDCWGIGVIMKQEIGNESITSEDFPV